MNDSTDPPPISRRPSEVPRVPTTKSKSSEIARLDERDMWLARRLDRIDDGQVAMRQDLRTMDRDIGQARVQIDALHNALAAVRRHTDDRIRELRELTDKQQAALSERLTKAEASIANVRTMARVNATKIGLIAAGGGVAGGVAGGALQLLASLGVGS